MGISFLTAGIEHIWTVLLAYTQHCQDRLNEPFFNLLLTQNNLILGDSPCPFPVISGFVKNRKFKLVTPQDPFFTAPLPSNRFQIQECHSTLLRNLLSGVWLKVGDLR